MADQNKDRTNQSALTGGSPAGLGAGTQGSTNQFSGTSSATGASAIPPSSAAGSSGGMDYDNTRSTAGTSSTAENVKQSGMRIASEARQYAGDMANRAKEKSRTVFDERKETTVGQVNTVAHAFRSTADQLQGEGQDQVARYVGIAAEQLEAFSNRLREKDLDTLISDAQNLARRSPTAFFAGTVAAGFLLARFLKSSDERQANSMALSRRDRDTGQDVFSSSESAAYNATAGEYASTDTDNIGVPGTSAASPGILGDDGTPSTARGTTSVSGTSTSPLSGSNTGGTTP